MDSSSFTMVVFAALTLLSLAALSAGYRFKKQEAFLTVLMFTPGLSVLAAKLICRESLSGLGLAPGLRENWPWYAAAWLLTPLISYAGAVVYFLVFPGDFDPHHSHYALESGGSRPSLLITLPLAVIVNPLMGLPQCLGEELAWRGYLLPWLAERMDCRLAVLAVGIIWGLWHGPIVMMGVNYGTERPICGAATMVLFCTVLGVTAGWLYYQTGSVWGPVVFHAAINGIDFYKPSALCMSKKANPFLGPDQIGLVGMLGYIMLALMIIFLA